VIIDFPQAVDASSNQNARKLLLRDVDNLRRFLARWVPERKALPYAEEMWQLYQRGELTPDVHLTGRYRPAENKVDTESMLSLIADAERDERHRRSKLGLDMRGTAERPQNDAPRRPGQGGPPRQGRDPRAAQSTRAPTVVVAGPNRRGPIEARQPPPLQPTAAGRGQGQRPQPQPRAPQPPAAPRPSLPQADGAATTAGSAMKRRRRRRRHKPKSHSADPT
jgi:RIO kinase 1